MHNSVIISTPTIYLNLNKTDEVKSLIVDQIPTMLKVLSNNYYKLDGYHSIENSTFDNSKIVYTHNIAETLKLIKEDQLMTSEQEQDFADVYDKVRPNICKVFQLAITDLSNFSLCFSDEILIDKYSIIAEIALAVDVNINQFDTHGVDFNQLMDNRYITCLKNALSEVAELQNKTDFNNQCDEIIAMSDTMENIPEDISKTLKCIKFNREEFYLMNLYQKAESRGENFVSHCFSLVDQYISQNPDKDSILGVSTKEVIIPKMLSVLQEELIPSNASSLECFFWDPTNASRGKDIIKDSVNLFENISCYFDFTGSKKAVKLFGKSIGESEFKAILSHAIVMYITSINFSLDANWYNSSYHREDDFTKICDDFFTPFEKSVNPTVASFKAEAYRAFILLMFKVLDSSEQRPFDFYKLISKVINKALTLCPELTLETFNLEHQSFEKLSKGDIPNIYGMRELSIFESKDYLLVNIFAKKDSKKDLEKINSGLPAVLLPEVYKKIKAHLLA